MIRHSLILPAALLAVCSLWGGGRVRSGVWDRIAEAKPPAEYLRWQKIPWLTDLSDAIRIAKAEKRPLFIWGSDDDPLDRC